MQIQITRRVEKSKVKKNSWTVKLDHLCKETSRHVYLSNGPAFFSGYEINFCNFFAISFGPAVASSNPSDGILQTDLNARSCFSKQAYSWKREYQLLNAMWNTLINNKKKANSQEKTSDLKIENFPKLSQKMWKNIKTEHYT